MNWLPLAPLAESFLPKILAASEGRPLLTIGEAARALALLGSSAGTPSAVRKVIAKQVLPPAAMMPRRPGGAIRVYAVGLAAWLAGDLRAEPRVPRQVQAIPVSRKPLRNTGAPNVVLHRLTPEETKDFVLPRGERFPPPTPGSDKAPAPKPRWHGSRASRYTPKGS